MKNWKMSALLNDPLGIVIAVATIALCVEYSFMALLHDTLIPMLPFNFSDTAWDVIDSVMLAAVLSLVLYFLVFRKMQRDEMRSRQIIQTSMDGFYVADTKGYILDVNDAYCQLIGYARGELLNMRIADVEAKENPDETARHMQEIKSHGHARFETRHKRKDGQLLDIEASVVYRQDLGKEYFIVFLRDITQRKQDEIHLAEQLEELRRWHNATSGREERILNLKHEVNELLVQAGQPPHYPSAET